MAKYNLKWNKSDIKLTITDADDDKNSDHVVGQLNFSNVGELPPTTLVPQPYQHLRNVALQQGVDDYGLVTVVNDSSNKLLDKLVQIANADTSSRMEQREDMLTDEDQDVDVNVTEDTKIDILNGSNILSDNIDVGAEEPVQLGTVVAQAHAESNLSVEDWNALPEQEIEERLQAVVNAMTKENKPAEDTGEKTDDTADQAADQDEAAKAKEDEAAKADDANKAKAADASDDAGPTTEEKAEEEKTAPAPAEKKTSVKAAPAKKAPASKVKNKTKS